jgi:hypothetical protein
MCLYGTLFSVRCIVHTITCNTATISHINNQTFYHSRVYTVHYFVFVLICDIVAVLQVIVCTIQRIQNNVPYKHRNGRMFGW